MPLRNTSVLLAKLITRALVKWTSLLRRLGLLDLLPGSYSETFASSPELGLKPSDVERASLFAGLLMVLAIGAPASLYLLHRSPGQAALLFSLSVVLAIIVSKGPSILIQVGAERFSLEFQRGLAESFGRIVRALERGDEVALVEAMRSSSPEVRRLLAEAQLSAGMGDRDLPEALAEEAGMWPAEAVRSLQMVHAALRNRKIRESFARALGRASLDVLRTELESPVVKARERVSSARRSLETAGFLVMVLSLFTFIPSLSSMAILYRINGFRISAWAIAALLISSYASIRVWRLLSKVDMDPESATPPPLGDVRRILVASFILSIPAIVMNPVFALVPPLIALSYRLVGVKPLSSLALEELANAIRVYSSLRSQGLNRLAAMDRTISKVSHPEVRSWLQAARNTWQAQERDVLWATVAGEISQYTGLHSFLKSFDEADLNDSEDARDSLVSVLEEALSEYSRSVDELMDELAEDLRAGLYAATFLPLAGIFVSWLISRILFHTPIPLVGLLAVLSLPLATLLGYVRSARRIGHRALAAGVLTDIAVVALIYGVTILIVST